MMLPCTGYPHEGWRKEGGYWGQLLKKCRLGNSKSHRKQLYTAWKRNMNNFRDRFFDRVKIRIENEVYMVFCSRLRIRVEIKLRLNNEQLIVHAVE